MKLEFGDWLERTEAQFIREHLPAYEHIWSTFLGNDGSNNLMPMDGLDPSKVQARQRFAEYHYSILEGVCCLRRVCGAYSPPKQMDIDLYLDGLNTMVLAYAHAARLQDLLTRAFAQVKGTYHGKGLNNIWTQRNIVLHDRKVPLMMHLDELCFPKINESSVNDWNEKSTWATPAPNSFRALSAILVELRNATIQEVQIALSQLVSPAKTFFAGKIIIPSDGWTPLPKHTELESTAPLQTHGTSGYSGIRIDPSGVEPSFTLRRSAPEE